ncbi:uncharacterized protein HaLaN_21444, partial [Haematococcus lacustris]
GAWPTQLHTASSFVWTVGGHLNRTWPSWPNTASSSLPKGQEMGLVSSISSFTSRASLAPTTRPYLQGMACGMISPNRSTAETDMRM